YSNVLYNGQYFSPEAEFLLAAIAASQKSVNGEVRLKLYKGNVIVEGRSSKTSGLYDMEESSMDVQGGFSPVDSEGFIKIQSIRLKKWGLSQKLLRHPVFELTKLQSFSRADPSSATINIPDSTLRQRVIQWKCAKGLMNGREMMTLKTKRDEDTNDGPYHDNADNGDNDYNDKYNIPPAQPTSPAPLTPLTPLRPTTQTTPTTPTTTQPKARDVGAFRVTTIDHNRINLKW
ncbi:argininosuccinate synthetase, partial [Modicella reniformis]